RVMATRQADAFQGFRIGNFRVLTGGTMPINRVDSTVVNQGGPGLEQPLVGNYAEVISDGIHGTPRMAMETRPTNAAYYPRIHA
ncbi:hypothetical protein ACOTFQ_31885, partial [Achromobacter xylosoxidans]